MRTTWRRAVGIGGLPAGNARRAGGTKQAAPVAPGGRTAYPAQELCPSPRTVSDTKRGAAGVDVRIPVAGGVLSPVSCLTPYEGLLLLGRPGIPVFLGTLGQRPGETGPQARQQRLEGPGAASQAGRGLRDQPCARGQA